MPFNDMHVAENGVTWVGFKVQEAYFRVEFTNKETGHQFKKICHTNEQLANVIHYHATAIPGDIYYNCEMKIIHCITEAETQRGIA